MKKTIIFSLVLLFVVIVKFCSAVDEVVAIDRLGNTNIYAVEVHRGDKTIYTLAEGERVISEKNYISIEFDRCIIVAKNENGYHIYNRFGHLVNDTYFKNYQTTRRDALLKHELGIYIYDVQSDILSPAYQEVIRLPNSYLIKAENGWGVIDTNLDGIIPSEYKNILWLQTPQHMMFYGAQNPDNSWKIFALSGKYIKTIPQRSWNKETEEHLGKDFLF